jgi:hypothetical protein
LRAFQRRKCGVRVCAVWSSRAPQTSWRRKAPGWSGQAWRSNRRQPSSLREGAMSARSSASRRMCWPSLARRVTTRVTAFFGSLVTVAPRERRRADRFGALRGFRLGMSAAIVLQTVLMARRTGSGGNCLVEICARRRDRTDLKVGHYKTEDCPPWSTLHSAGGPRRKAGPTKERETQNTG